MLHWAGGLGIVCVGDIFTMTTDRKWLSFMRSYPNFIPLSAHAVEHIGAVLKPFAYETIYAHYFDRVIANDAKTVLETSVARYVASIEGKQAMNERATTFDVSAPSSPNQVLNRLKRLFARTAY